MLYFFVLILKKLKEYDLSLEKKAFIDTCFKSKKWSKWVQSSTRTHEYLSVLCGHYNFTTSESVDALNKINEYENFNFLVKEKIKNDVISRKIKLNRDITKNILLTRMKAINIELVDAYIYSNYFNINIFLY
mgnify:CR=1 FL=1